MDEEIQNYYQKQMDEFSKAVHQAYSNLGVSLKSTGMQKLLNPAQNFGEIQQKMVQIMIEELQSIEKNFYTPLLEFSKKIQDLTAKKHLYQNGWIISPTIAKLPLGIKLQEKDISSLSNKELNAIFIDAFYNNNYEIIETMINEWKKTPFFQDRIAIFCEALLILREYRQNKNKNSQGINPARVLIPLLISQLDGLYGEYLIASGLRFDKTRAEMLDGSTVNKYDTLGQHALGDLYSIDTMRMIQEHLFQTVYPKNQAAPKNKAKETSKNVRPFLSLSRNKIMHGEDIRYGTIDNLIRIFLLLDCLAYTFRKRSEAEKNSLVTRRIKPSN